MQMILPGARSNKGHLVPRGGGEGTFGTRASSARLNRGPNIYDSPPPLPVFIIVDVTRFREVRKARGSSLLRISAIVA